MSVRNVYTLGLVTGFCLGCLYFMVPTIIDGFRKPAEKPKQVTPSIEVVDTYNGCDILRYAPPLGAKYQYFMDCSK